MNDNLHTKEIVTSDLSNHTRISERSGITSVSSLSEFKAAFVSDGAPTAGSLPKLELGNTEFSGKVSDKLILAAETASAHSERNEREPVDQTKLPFTKPELDAAITRNNARGDEMFPINYNEPPGSEYNRRMLEQERLASQYLQNKEGFSNLPLTPEQIAKLGPEAIKRLDAYVKEDQAKHLTFPVMKR